MPDNQSQNRAIDDIYIELRPSLLKKPHNWIIIALALATSYYLKFMFNMDIDEFSNELLTYYGSGIFFIMGIYMILDKIWDKYTTKYYINNREIRCRSGFIIREADSCLPSDILSLRLEQTFLERMVDIGHIEIATAGTDDKEIILYGLKDPITYRNLIHDLTTHNRSVE